MARNHGPVRPCSGWPVRAFTVVEESMRPRLDPGDLVLAIRGGRPRPGQMRVFRHPRLSTRWVVKTVGEVFTATTGTIFEARSENRAAVGASDSHDFGPVAAAGSYLVVWRSARRVTGTVGLDEDEPGQDGEQGKRDDAGAKKRHQLTAGVRPRRRLPFRRRKRRS